uniref:Uncharacterized protein n=1 Tax=Romanomermis culicivorax TaxID=13658 RepID=A0A915KFK3_ROMCU
MLLHSLLLVWNRQIENLLNSEFAQRGIAQMGIAQLEVAHMGIAQLGIRALGNSLNLESLN